MALRLSILLPEQVNHSRALPQSLSFAAIQLTASTRRSLCTTRAVRVPLRNAPHGFPVGCRPPCIPGTFACCSTQLPGRGVTARHYGSPAGGVKGDNSMASLAQEVEDGLEMSIQGVQGDDCITFETWLASCRRYGLANCDQQLQGIQTGRKTLGQVLAEQDRLIQEIAEDYRRRAQATAEAELQQDTGPDPQGPQGAGIFALPEIDAPCPQGIQGEDCAKFRIWLENCHKFGFGNCLEQMQGLQQGRKTLAQVFAEQEALIREVVQQHQQQKRSYSTDARVVGGAGTGPDAGPLHGTKVASTLQADRARGTLDFSSRGYSSSSSSPSPPPPPQQDSQTAAEAEKRLSQRDRLKRAIKEYGATVVVFHVAISLASLGGFYLAVSSGLDVVGLLQKLGVGEQILQSRLATGTSTFVVAYAVHKVFAPARIAVTLTCTPFIVRYLRRIGFLKVKVPPPTKP